MRATDHPTPKTEADFFELRKEGKIYVSKAFKVSDRLTETRFVRIVFEDSSIVLAGEINGILTLRQSDKKKQQVAVILNQDDKKIRKITLQRFNERKSGNYKTTDEHSFTFREDEFHRLLAFLKSLQYIDFSNKENFQIEDLSTNTGNKALIDSTDKDIIKVIQNIQGEERVSLLNQIRHSLTKKDVDILLGRKESLEVFKTHLKNEDWDESEWQTFFSENDWIFGYGLNYQFINLLKEQPDYGGRNFTGKGSQRGDFLLKTNAFSQFTVLVEIKTPSTTLLSYKNNSPHKLIGPRNDVWLLSSNLLSAVSQIQVNARTWSIDSQKAENIRQLEGQSIYTVEPKGLLVIGNTKELNGDESIVSCFESFRRNLRNPEIITFDELYERANFIVGNNSNESVSNVPEDTTDDLPF